MAIAPEQLFPVFRPPPGVRIRLSTGFAPPNVGVQATPHSFRLLTRNIT